MSKKAFDKISEGLTEALAVARGEAEPAKLHVPHDISVRSIRQRAGMTQDEFARTYGFSVGQIRDWEQGRNRPAGCVRLYLLLIGSDPEGTRSRISTAIGEIAA